MLLLVPKLPHSQGEERMLEESVSPDWNPPTSPKVGKIGALGLHVRKVCLGALCVRVRVCERLDL